MENRFEAQIQSISLSLAVSPTEASFILDHKPFQLHCGWQA